MSQSEPQKDPVLEGNEPKIGSKIGSFEPVVNHFTIENSCIFRAKPDLQHPFQTFGGRGANTKERFHSLLRCLRIGRKILAQ